jgi:hypothetical protein
MPTSDLAKVGTGNSLAHIVSASARAIAEYIGFINKDNTGPPIIPSIVDDRQLSPGISGPPSVTVSYTDSEGTPHTQVVQIKENTFSVVNPPQSALYAVELTPERQIMLDSIHNLQTYNDPTSPYNNFYDEEKIKIISDGLMRVFNHELPPRKGFIEMVKTILISSMGLTSRDPKYTLIMDNVEEGMGDYRFKEFNKDTANRDARVANFLKLFDDEIGTGVHITKELMTEFMPDVFILIGDFISRHIPIIKTGGRKSKNRYNYAHFIPLNPNSKKSFHNGISRKVKSRRRKQYRNKHTMRRK